MSLRWSRRGAAHVAPAADGHLVIEPRGGHYSLLVEWPEGTSWLCHAPSLREAKRVAAELAAEYLAEATA